MSAHVRMATGLDREDIRGVYLSAFPAGENQLVAKLADSLLDERTDPATISLVAEVAGRVVGHIAFSPVTAGRETNWLGYILAPLGVQPEYQRVDVGSRLIERGIELLATKLASTLFVYGDPKYYGRFGFSTEAAARFVPPCDLAHPFGWQARMLRGECPADAAIELSCVQSLRDPALW